MDGHDAGPAGRAAEAAFLSLVAGIGLVGWVAVILAEVGRLRAGDLVVGLVVALAGLLVLRAGLRARVCRRSGPGTDPGGDAGARDAGSETSAADPSREAGAGDAGNAPSADRPSREARKARSAEGNGGAGAGGRRGVLAASLGAVLVLLIAAAAFLPPFESVLWAGDATVYMAIGRKLAETGTLHFEDSLLAQIPVAARQELFRNPVASDATGAYARFPGGFLIPEVSEPEVAAGFAPLFPALLALAWALFGRAGALHLTPVLALLSVAAVCLVGRRLAGPTAGPFAGLLAGLLLAVSLPQIWFARLSMAEVVAQLFVFAGLLALLASRDDLRLSPGVGALFALGDGTLLALGGGALFGLAMLAKLELIAVLPAAVAGFVAVALASGSEALRRRTMYFAAPFFLLLLHAVVHLFALPSHYQPFLMWKLDALGASRLLGAPVAEVQVWIAGLAAGGAVALAGLTWWLLYRRRSKRWAAAPIAVIAVWAVGYAAASSNRLAETLPWLGWYLSWPVVAVFFMAAAVFFAGAVATLQGAGAAARISGAAAGVSGAAAGAAGISEAAPGSSVAARGAQGRTGASSRGAGSQSPRERSAVLYVLVLVAVAGFAFLYDPQEPARHIWSVRRLVPIVLPGMLLVVAAGVAAMAARLPARRRAWLVAPVVALLVGLVARPALVVAGPPPWEGAVDAAERLARRLPAGAVLLVSHDLAGTHLATTLGYIYGTGGADAILLQPRYRQPATLEDLVLEWLRSDRGVFLLIGDRAPHLAAPRLALSPVAEPFLQLRMLEETTDRRPEKLLEEGLRLHLFRVEAAAEKRSVDVGSLGEDFLFDLRGFHAPERERDGATFRWTGGFAAVDLHGAGEQVRIVLAGDRPEGAPAARIAVHIGEQLVVEDLAVGAGPQTIVVENPAHGAAGLSTPDGPQQGATGSTTPGRPGQGAAGGSTRRMPPEATGKTTLTIESTVFSPRALGLSADERQLGVKVYRIEY
jgi:hypothetical protein